MALLLPLLLLAALLQAPSAEAGWDIGYNGYWGTWGSSDYCPNGHHVVRFKVKIEGIQYDGDDTALNAIRLECSNGQTLYSKEAPWGDWYESPYSSEGFTSTDFLLEGNQRSYVFSIHQNFTSHIMNDLCRNHLRLKVCC